MSDAFLPDEELDSDFVERFELSTGESSCCGPSSGSSGKRQDGIFFFHQHGHSKLPLIEFVIVDNGLLPFDSDVPLALVVNGGRLLVDA